MTARVLAGLLVAGGLYLTSLYSYLLFHGLTEVFSIAVAIATFMLVWNSRQFLNNNSFLLLGLAYLFVGLVDLCHTLAYPGMGAITGYGTNLSTQLWVVARYLESLAFLSAPWFLRRRLRPDLALLGLVAVTSLLMASIFYWKNFPVCFVDGMGLTPFKKISEYLISAILLAAAGLFYRRRRELDQSVFRLLIASIAFTIAAELSFTLYITAYAFPNLVGHFLKLVSCYLIYKTLIELGLRQPYHLLFRELKQSEEALRRSNDILAAAQRIAHLGSWEYDLATGKGLWSEEVHRIFGLEPGEVDMGVDAFMDRVHPEDREALREEAEKAVAGGDIHGLEYRVVRPDGHERIVSTQGRVIRDENGVALRAIGAIQDITDRKRGEEELQRYAQTQAVLLREVNHRVKNNLAAIISMLHIEEKRAAAGSESYRANLRELAGRVRGLSTVHSLLSASQWRPLPLSKLCRRVVSGALQGVPLGQRINWEVTPSSVEVSSNQAQHLTLVINEVATNWVKHAMLGRDALRAQVRIQADGNAVLLEFLDDGPGFPEQMLTGDPDRASFGVGLIDRIVKESLGGTLTLKNEEGAVTTICFQNESPQNTN